MEAIRIRSATSNHGIRSFARDIGRAMLAALIGVVSLAATSFAPAASAAPAVLVVEYGQGGWGVWDYVPYRYFMTANPDEIALLDKATTEWARTGRAFAAYANAGAAPGAVDVCRFFGTDRYRANGSRIGPDSHFYTADAAECEFVKSGYRSVAADGVSYPAWTFEGSAFAAARPVGGSCPTGTVPVYRAYNNGEGGNPNHRYSTSLADAPTGWTAEGVAMCVPVLPAIAMPNGAEVRGCEPSEAPSGSGWPAICLAFDLVNTTADVVRVLLPAGTSFVALDPKHQGALLGEDIEFLLAASSRSRVAVKGYSLNRLRFPPPPLAAYSLSGAPTNPRLLDLLAIPRAPADGYIKRTVTQLAIWEITDGRGELTARQAELVALVYATPEPPVGTASESTATEEQLRQWFIEFAHLLSWGQL
jgi:hypothetical protein